MPTILRRRSVARAAALAVLLAPGLARGQSPTARYYQDVPRESGTLYNRLVTGVQYDILNKAKAENRLASGRPSPYRADRLRYRIAVDCWLIRKNSLMDPGVYPPRPDALILP